MVNAQSRRDEVVHDDEPHVLGVASVAVEAKELGQQRPRVLREVDVVPGQQLAEEVALAVLDRLQHELVVGGHVEDAARGAGVGQFPQRTSAHGRHEVDGADPEQRPEVAEDARRVGAQSEAAVLLRGHPQRLNGREVAHQQVLLAAAPVRLTVHALHGQTQTLLHRVHDLRRQDALVRHFAVDAHASVAESPVLHLAASSDTSH